MHEGRSALARALVEHGTYFLPVRLDDSELPGLRSTIGYVDARSTNPEELADMILEKLGDVPGPPASGVTLVDAPVATPDEVRSRERDAALVNAVAQGDCEPFVIEAWFALEAGCPFATRMKLK